VEVTAIDISPNACPVESELRLRIEFTASRAIPRGLWEVKVCHQAVLCSPLLHCMCHLAAVWSGTRSLLLTACPLATSLVSARRLPAGVVVAWRSSLLGVTVPWDIVPCSARIVRGGGLRRWSPHLCV
jgi:hypothetical protein